MEKFMRVRSYREYNKIKYERFCSDSWKQSRKKAGHNFHYGFRTGQLDRKPLANMKFEGNGKSSHSRNVAWCSVYLSTKNIDFRFFFF